MIWIGITGYRPFYHGMILDKYHLYIHSDRIAKAFTGRGNVPVSVGKRRWIHKRSYSDSQRCVLFLSNLLHQQSLGFALTPPISFAESIISNWRLV